MNIYEATHKANEERKGISRTSWGNRAPLLIPTNTISGCIVITFEGQLTSKWQPEAEDLMADDWVVLG